MTHTWAQGGKPEPTRHTCTTLAWTGAGKPRVLTEDDLREPLNPRALSACYWCGACISKIAHVHNVASIDWLPDSFPAHNMAAAPKSKVLCEACCWSMGQRNALPVAYGAERITKKAEQGRRADVEILGRPAQKLLILRLDSGRIGTWSPGKNATEEEAWTKAIPQLRANPETVGACRFLATYDLSELAPASTERMQSYHHFATASTWWPCTDTDRAKIRAWLLDPPTEPWVGAISDGKKHGLPFSTVSPGTAHAPLQLVYFLGDIIPYAPSVLGSVVDAIERLIIAGASDDEITTGRYHTTGAAFIRERAASDPLIAVHRGGPLLGLALYLRRNRKELSNVRDGEDPAIAAGQD